MCHHRRDEDIASKPPVPDDVEETDGEELPFDLAEPRMDEPDLDSARFEEPSLSSDD